MTIINYNEDGVVCEEIVFATEPDTGKLIKVCEWYYNGKTLTYVQYRNRDMNGNYYKTESVSTNVEYWINNKVRQS